MIEINLYAIPEQDLNARVGRCLARTRFDKEAMGVSVENFIKGFLKDNIDRLETKFRSNEINNIINTSSNLTRRDISCLNYYLAQEGFMVTFANVADDEENATGVPDGDVVEWNIIDRNFYQYDLPTIVKIMPEDGTDVVSTLHKVVDTVDMFSSDRFEGLKNPFKELFENIDRIKDITGSVNSTLVSRVYEILDSVGISVFCATSEN